MSLFKKKYMPFLYSELGEQKAADCLFHVLPVPLEQSVSYGGGTANGPKAILDASQQLELYDGFLVPAEKGIYTCEPVDCKQPIEKVLYDISNNIRLINQQKKVPVMLGGEHSVTIGAVMGLKDAGLDFAVVQFDAHADLRSSYDNNEYSHACVMRRVYDMDVPFVQIGVRSLSPREVQFRKEHAIEHYDAYVLYSKGVPRKILPRSFPRKIYITFDIDALDNSLVPATGTPEPGGLSWWQAMEFIQKISGETEIIGCDVVELASRKDDHSSDFTAARLVYNMMGYTARSVSYK